jgi:hypothetical protein
MAHIGPLHQNIVYTDIYICVCVWIYIYIYIWSIAKLYVIFIDFPIEIY